MADMIETVREKARTKGFKEGVLAERLQTINLLSRIGAAPNVEAAVMAEHGRLEALQAAEVSAMHSRPSGGGVDDAAFEAQYAMISRLSGRAGSAPAGSNQLLDDGDKVAAAMGLPPAGSSEPSSPPAQRQAGSQPVDDMDKVAAAMGL